MNVYIHRQHPDSTTALDEQIASSLQRALGQLAARVGDVTVHLRAAHGARGEMHTHCRMVAALPMSQIVVVESLYADEA